MPVPAKLLPAQLYNRRDSDAFEFNSTAELDGTTGIVGQERALDTSRLGMGIWRDGASIFSPSARRAPASNRPSCNF